VNLNAQRIAEEKRHVPIVENRIECLRRETNTMMKFWESCVIHFSCVEFHTSTSN
jgi:hypothetical protein